MNHRSLAYLLAAFAMSIILNGCGGISEPPVTGFQTTSGHGHSISVQISNKAVPYGGKAIIQVAVQDASGNPVPAELLTNKMFFSSILGGTFSTSQTVSNGLVVCEYTAPNVASGKGASIRGAGLPSDLPIDDEIVVSYDGAMAKIAVMLYRLS